MKIVLASHNPGKIKEFQQLLQSFDVQIIAQSELNIVEAEETGLSFIENAIIKARHASQHSNLPALADDSGLVVPALDGAPGIYSARYAGVNTNSQQNIDKLLNAMQAMTGQRRDAYFYCALAFVTHANDPTPLISLGQWQGSIASTPSGKDGFGYDPVFYVPNEQKTAAELNPNTKSKLSHRGQALQQLIHHLKDKLHECTLS